LKPSFDADCDDCQFKRDCFKENLWFPSKCGEKKRRNREPNLVFIGDSRVRKLFAAVLEEEERFFNSKVRRVLR